MKEYPLINAIFEHLNKTLKGKHSNIQIFISQNELIGHCLFTYVKHTFSFFFSLE